MTTLHKGFRLGMAQCHQLITEGIPIEDAVVVAVPRLREAPGFREVLERLARHRDPVPLSRIRRWQGDATAGILHVLTRNYLAVERSGWSGFFHYTLTPVSRALVACLQAEDAKPDVLYHPMIASNSIISRSLGWQKAYGIYQRLRADQASWPANEGSALKLLRGAVREAGVVKDILAALSEADSPLTSIALQARVPWFQSYAPEATQNLDVRLNSLLEDDPSLVARAAVRTGTGGRKFLWRLSDLGRKVMEVED